MLSNPEILAAVVNAYKPTGPKDPDYRRIRKRLIDKGLRSRDGSKYYSRVVDTFLEEGITDRPEVMAWCLANIPDGHPRFPLARRASILAVAIEGMLKRPDVEEGQKSAIEYSLKLVRRVAGQN